MPDSDSNEPTIRRARTNRDWWPEAVDLRSLHRGDTAADPLGPDFDYDAELAKLDFDALKADVMAVLTNSQEWWPADYGHYGPLFVRLSWHAAGTYRISDGRGGAGQGMQRFAPLNSWPDNASLDKARRLLWPVKQKYGTKVSWADLLVFAGNCAIEDMGLETLGFAFGRADMFEPDDTDWGAEADWLGDERYSGERDLQEPLGAVQMGLIYVNPEGPNGQPDPVAAARDIRETFARMAMDDTETVALIAGGHTFGKAHGAHPDDGLGAEPEGASLEGQGFGWQNEIGTGSGVDTVTSGLEGAWTQNPTRWDGEFFDNLYENTYELTESPAGAKQWVATNPEAVDSVPDAHDPAKRHSPMMLTTDLALKADPAYAEISAGFHSDPDSLGVAFAQAWFKLLHRDMGPVSRYRGPWVPAEELIWQDPVPAVDHDLVDEADVAALKEKVLASGIGVAQLVAAAWSSAATFRGTDKRGGANGARVRLAPQRDWAVNDPQQLAQVLNVLEAIQAEFNEAQTAKAISLADLIVLAGAAAVEKAARDGGHDVVVPFAPGRTDASAEQTDADSFAVLEPRADGFRNYQQPGDKGRPERDLIDRAELLTLTGPEMTALVGGLRSIGANTGGTSHGVLTDRPGTLSNDFFVNLLDMSTVWKVSAAEEGVYEGIDRSSGEPRWTGTAVDLAFGASSQLRALAEVYASDDAEGRLVSDFVAAWDKVMTLDRFDLR